MDAYITGAERASMDLYMFNFIDPILKNVRQEDIKKYIFNLKDPSLLDLKNEYFVEKFTASIKNTIFSNNFTLKKDGVETSNYCLLLNTVYRLGSDPVKLITRLHAQCEHNLFVKPENFLWLSKIIRDGLKIGLLRTGEGWDSLLEDLSTVKNPVVTWFSGGESFMSKSSESKVEEEWKLLSRDERFDILVKELDSSLELKPENWNDYYFDKDLSLLDFTNG